MDTSSEPSGDGRGQAREAQRSWTFLTNHAHVLLAISATPDLRLKDIAARVEVTERTAMQIVTDLEQSGIIEREKHGRRNHYIVRPHHPLRHPLEEHHEVADLIAAISHQSTDVIPPPH